MTGTIVGQSKAVSGSQGNTWITRTFETLDMLARVQGLLKCAG